MLQLLRGNNDVVLNVQNVESFQLVRKDEGYVIEAKAAREGKFWDLYTTSNLKAAKVAINLIMQTAEQGHLALSLDQPEEDLNRLYESMVDDAIDKLANQR